MPRYISFIKYTQQGIENIEASPGRIQAARKAIEAVGGKMLSYHVTMGQYDGVALLELEDDTMAATVALGVGKLGNSSTETVRAFTEDEFTEIVGHLAHHGSAT